MLLRFFYKPYPLIFNAYSVLIPSVVTFALILFLKPLGFSEIELVERTVVALVISVIVGTSIFVVVKALQRWFPNYMNEDRWTLGKEVLLWLIVLFIIICSISIVFMSVTLYKRYGDQSVLSSSMFFHLFLNTAYITLGISIIPMIVLVLFEQHNHQKKQYQKAQELSSLLQKKLRSIKTGVSKEDKLIFSSENKEIELQVNASDVIFIHSEGNYIEVNYVNDTTLQKKLIRHRIKAMEEQLPEDIFFRCHNRYIINTNRITNVNGNARGLYVEVENSKVVIPVSRSKVKAFKALFEK